MNRFNKIVLGSRYTRIGSAHGYITGERLQAVEAIRDLVQAEAEYVETPCLCGGLKSEKLLSKIDRWGLPISAVLCNNCGLIRLNPRWDNATYVKIYQNFFWPLQTGSFSVDRKRFDLSVERAVSFADALQSTYDLAGKKIVEIGCSYGAGLSNLSNKGADLVGYDYDERIINLGKSYSGLDLRTGGLEGALRDGEKFDLVILKHVFEHFFNPLTEGSKLKSLLNEKGKIFIEVPGIFNDGLWQPDPIMVFNAFHTYYYSFSTLAKILAVCGFVNDSPENEGIMSLWRQSEEIIPVAWQNSFGATKTLHYLLKKEEDRKKKKIFRFMQNIINNHFGWLKR